jgi:hypothetical protein
MNRRGFLKGATAAIAAACIPKIEKPRSPVLAKIDTETQKIIPAGINISWGIGVITITSVWLDEEGKEHCNTTEWSLVPKAEHIQKMKDFLGV